MLANQKAIRMYQFKILVFAFLLGTFQLFAQIPSGYYNDAQGLGGTELRQALHNIIDGHDSQSYSSLWTHFRDTDRKSNNKVWDMYSDVPGGTAPYEFAFVSDQCGSYQHEGDCYNREHSFPKSWFNEGYPMYTDLFHLVPTDGYVNGQRGNYAYGEINTVFWESENGSKVGSSGFSNMTGTVFEPIDEYKGDFARIYFYMSTRYFNEDAGWYSNSLVDGADITNVGVALLLKWHSQDPVSQKEIDRNEAIFDIQDNRNPYVDHPEYVEAVWGSVNVPPYFVSFINDQTITEGETLSFNIEFVDNEPQQVEVSYDCIFCNADFVNVSRVNDTVYNFQIAPQSGDLGTYQLVVLADDGVNSVVNYTFQLQVEEGNGLDDPTTYFDILPTVSSQGFSVLSTSHNEYPTSFNIYSIGGKLVESFSLNGNYQYTFGQNYQNGTYILRVVNPYFVYAQKLIKQ